MPEETDAEIKAEYGESFVAAWLDEIKIAGEEEKDWRDDADRASKLYRGDKSSKPPFNIFHANIETVCPALYNSTPSPDVRRRFADRDPVAKVVSDLLERGLAYSIDAYDFDDEIEAAVQDMAIVDRGLTRVRYVPYFGPDGQVASEDVTCEYVPWRSFRHGPARLWKDVPWVAFEHFLSRSQVAQLAGDRWESIRNELAFTFSAAAKDDADNKTTEPRFGKRAHIWEIWDKDERKVYFIATDFGQEPIAVMDDPLGLQMFFPIARPMMAVSSTDSLTPVVPLTIYEALLDELNKLTRRISNLIGQCRPRGWYAGLQVDDFKTGVEADDGELIPMTSAEGFAANAGGLDKLISWFPLEPVVATLKQLVEQREIIKQIIFEISGMADIMRGQVDPKEKLGQTQIKAQWGGLRVQTKQDEVARYIRDLFRMKAEIICNKFSMDTLLQMTGIELPSQQEKEALQAEIQQAAQMAQAQQQPVPPPPPDKVKMLASPTREEVEKLLRSDASRGWRIDIESDSHIRGDIMRIQQQMTLFIQGTASFVGAIGPLVQQGAMPGHIAIKIFTAFARHYDLGKSAEDAIEQWGDELEKTAAQPQQQKPDPKAEAAKAEAEAAQQKAKLDVETAKAKHGLTMKKMQGEAQLGEQKLGMQRQELAMDAERMQMDVWASHQEAMAQQQQNNVIPWVQP